MSDEDRTEPSDDVEPDVPQPGTPARRRLAWWQEGGLLVVAAIVLAVLLKSFVVQAYYVPSESMLPGLAPDDRIVVQKVSYWFGGSPQRGDVVVFEDPGGWLGETEEEGPGGVRGVLAAIGLYPEGGHLVKRVVGIPGDVVSCCDEQGRILVNGIPIDEGDYLAAPPPTQGPACNGPGAGTACMWSAGPVPAGQMFVLGDNRYFSADSSAHLCTEGETDCTKVPFVDEDLVVGKVSAVVWPRDRIHRVRRPHSFDDVPDPAPR